jgi:hypothetical protein
MTPVNLNALSKKKYIKWTAVSAHVFTDCSTVLENKDGNNPVGINS